MGSRALIGLFVASTFIIGAPAAGADTSPPEPAKKPAAAATGRGNTTVALTASSPTDSRDNGAKARRAYFEGLQHLEQGELPQAVELFQLTVSLTPEWSLAYLELGAAEHLREPGSQEARSALRKAVELAPYNARANYQLGVAYESAGLLAEASASLSAALKLRTDLMDAWFHFGAVLQASGDEATAAQAYEQVLKRSPQHLGALAALAELRERLGQLQLAEEALHRIAVLQPQVAYHHYRLAQFYERTGNEQKARQAFARANAIDPRPKRRMRQLR